MSYCLYPDMDVPTFLHYFHVNYLDLQPGLNRKLSELAPQGPSLPSAGLVKACCETMPSSILNSYVNFFACGIFNSTKIYWYLAWVLAMDSERAHLDHCSFSDYAVRRRVSETTARLLFSVVISACLSRFPMEEFSWNFIFEILT